MKKKGTKVGDTFRKGNISSSLWLNYANSTETFKGDPYLTINIQVGKKEKGSWRNNHINFTVNQGNTIRYATKKMVERGYEVISKNPKAFAKRLKNKEVKK